MLDYIVVGLGLSGIAVVRELEKRGKKFVVFENSSQNSSTVAGGVYNSVILKRFTLAWRANEQLGAALSFYEELEKELGFSIHKKVPIYRRFSSVEEQNNWFTASDNPILENYLDTTLQKHINPCVKGDFSFGKVNNSGIVDTSALINQYKNHLESIGFLKSENFDHDSLQVAAGHVQYNQLKAKSVVFCEGYGLRENPFFKYLPLNGNKGEYLVIKAPDLKLDVMVKSSIFIIPMGNDFYKVGASYKHQDKTTVPTEETRKELIVQLGELINCSYEIVGQEAGIRPATADRRPLLGQHPELQNLYVCNGFGSRGVIIGPTAGKQIVAFMEGERALSLEMDIQRFTKKYYKK